VQAACVTLDGIGQFNFVGLFSLIHCCVWHYMVGQENLGANIGKGWPLRPPALVPPNFNLTAMI
jgi:hypothetical protein